MVQPVQSPMNSCSHVFPFGALVGAGLPRLMPRACNGWR
jgi:hypothetical protein